MLVHIKKHYFFYIIGALIIMSAVASYYRFLVSYDYLVRYEGECNVEVQSCYVYCETDECADPFYYSWITASAKDIRKHCEDDITMCDFAFECVEKGSCDIEYCDTTIENCSSKHTNSSNL